MGMRCFCAQAKTRLINTKYTRRSLVSFGFIYKQFSYEEKEVDGVAIVINTILYIDAKKFFATFQINSGIKVFCCPFLNLCLIGLTPKKWCSIVSILLQQIPGLSRVIFQVNSFSTICYLVQYIILETLQVRFHRNLIG